MVKKKIWYFLQGKWRKYMEWFPSFMKRQIWELLAFLRFGEKTNMSADGGFSAWWKGGRRTWRRLVRCRGGFCRLPTCTVLQIYPKIFAECSKYINKYLELAERSKYTNKYLQFPECSKYTPKHLQGCRNGILANIVLQQCCQINEWLAKSVPNVLPNISLFENSEQI